MLLIHHLLLVVLWPHIIILVENTGRTALVTLSLSTLREILYILYLSNLMNTISDVLIVEENIIRKSIQIVVLTQRDEVSLSVTGVEWVLDPLNREKLYHINNHSV